MLFEFVTDIQENKNSQIYDLSEGFTKGNMFVNLYDPYKNYTPREIKPQTERQALLDKIYKLCFAINDLNLYLDTHPNDSAAYELFKKYSLMYDKCSAEYESKYQVLELTHDTYGKYTWINNPWPWNNMTKEDSYYV